MRCSECRETLSAMLDGEAAPWEVDAVKRHIGDCADCAGYGSYLEADRARLRRWPDEVPGEAAMGAALAWASRRRSGRRWMVAAASLILALSAGFLAGRLSGEAPPLPEATAPRRVAPIDEKRYYPDTNESYVMTVLAEADPAAMLVE